MANVIKNPRVSADYPKKFNKREVRASTHNYSVAVIDSALTIADDDAISAVRSTGANAVTLPAAGASTGRCITFIQADLATMTITQNADGANIDGADANFTGLDAADDWLELFCTGDEWIILKQHIS